MTSEEQDNGPGRKSGKSGKGRKGRKDSSKKGEKNDGGDEPQRPGKHHGGDPVEIHEEYVRRHLEGGEPATTDAYERALEQFQKLPGAVRRRPPARPQEQEEESEEPADEESEESSEGEPEASPDDESDRSEP